MDLVIDPDFGLLRWKDEDEYAHIRRLGIVSDSEHQAVELARAQVLDMLEARTGPFADAASWPAWRWNCLCKAWHAGSYGAAWMVQGLAFASVSAVPEGDGSRPL
ncbi:hypothetical protein ABZ370_41630 [Streptomyces sp. NPDC005962]|uniref:hypothetical protein n=1 Tax=Streptomyces sp. NPDC005962 TaxID=3154466 RepID=UPI0033FCCC77